ncbi:unnamed protein product [Rodentolepis nana]|uniref:Purine nucleoside phosphorylase n=1 Tax=Rodentolepis nana TaxID=102285 RepID=A0A158QIC5_RODNA|nr:unnamed protein product [Rodentolepis nana]
MASFDEVNGACEYLRKKVSFKPQVGLICGSGLSKLADGIRNPIVIPYEEIPNFPRTTGELFAEGAHWQSDIWYYGWKECNITLPIRVMKLLGCEYLIVTNATGTVHLNYNVGDLMVVKDHISIPALCGFNPLCGANDERFGPRFPALSDVYTKELRQLALKVADEMGIMDIMHEGVYLCVSGPTYDTPAEDRVLRLLGADVVGMSLTAEAIVAHHCGMKVLAISLITDRCSFENGTHTSDHEEVLRASLESSETITSMVTQILGKL